MKRTTWATGTRRCISKKTQGKRKEKKTASSCELRDGLPGKAVMTEKPTWLLSFKLGGSSIPRTPPGHLVALVRQVWRGSTVYALARKSRRPPSRGGLLARIDSAYMRRLTDAHSVPPGRPAVPVSKYPNALYLREAAESLRILIMDLFGIRATCIACSENVQVQVLRCVISANTASTPQRS